MANELKVYDLTSLKEACSNNYLFLHKMVGIFLDSTPKDLKHLENAIIKRDWKNIAFWSHKMKAGINGMNISGLKETIKKIEDLSNTSQTEDTLIEIHQLFKQINEVLQISFEQLKEEFAI